MTTLKYLKRKNVIALILVFVGALLPQVPFFPSENVFLQSYYNYILSIFLLIILIMLAYLLGYKNQIETLENPSAKNIKNDNLKNKKINVDKIINNNTKTITLDYSDGTTTGLEKAFIIVRASVISKSFTYFDYNIQPWAWEYLNKNKHLLK